MLDQQQQKRIIKSVTVNYSAVTILPHDQVPEKRETSPPSPPSEPLYNFLSLCIARTLVSNRLRHRRRQNPFSITGKEAGGRGNKIHKQKKYRYVVAACGLKVVKFTSVQRKDNIIFDTSYILYSPLIYIRNRYIL